MPLTQPITSSRSGRGLVPALLFFAVGIVSLAVACVVIWRHPEWLLNHADGEAPRLALATLFGIGWISSVVFGTAYHVVPMLAGMPWWSRRLPWLHFVLHLTGFGWCLAATVGVPGANWVHGAAAIVVGVGFFAYNQQLTAGRLSLWDPGTVTFTLAVFWLGVTTIMAVLVQTGHAGDFSRAGQPELIVLVAQLGLVGFGLMALLGAALKLVPMFLVSSARPAGLAWVGCFAVSAGLHTLAAGEIGRFEALREPAAWLIAAGAAAYLLELLRLIWCGRRALGWDLAAAALGLLFLLPLFTGLLTSLPQRLEAPEGGLSSAAHHGLVLALLGPCTMIAFGLAGRLLPLLAWQIRFANRAGLGAVPGLDQLARRRALAPMTLALVLGCGYLDAALVLNEKTGVVFAVAALLLATGLLVAAVAPGFRPVFRRSSAVSDPSRQNPLARAAAA